MTHSAEGAWSSALHFLNLAGGPFVRSCQESARKATEAMEQLGIQREHPSVHFGQILGIVDNLTLALGQAGYNACKLVLYGSFDEIFPWLLRRLDENRDLLGAAQQSRQLLVTEAASRILPKAPRLT